MEMVQVSSTAACMNLDFVSATSKTDYSAV
jgi:hypothetical protein